MNKVLKIGLIAGLLLSVLVLFSGCYASTSTTSADGEPVETSWFSQYGMLLFLVVIFALFYFVMIRPQRKRQKEHQQMMEGLQKGDRVVTAGGIYGTIDSLSDDSVVIKVEGGTTMRVARGSVAVRRDETSMSMRK
ncbi:MAG: preprotein translocase subunit YajC [Dehalococcoidales bacterium]|jgi:preprotein translocase subunit YajC